MSPDTRAHIQLPTAEHTHTIILLHGRDSTAEEFAEEFSESQASKSLTLPEIFPNFQWIFPTSELRNSARLDTKMSQWFDIWSVEESEMRKELQLDGLQENVSFIREVIEKEMAVVPAERIILGGISMGYATAIHALLALGRPLGGFIGMSSWMPLHSEMEDLIVTIRSGAKPLAATSLDRICGLSRSSLDGAEEANFARLASALATPILISHSKDDDVVPIRNGDSLVDCLSLLG